MVETLMPGFTRFHSLGARLAQECVRMTAGDFRSMIFPTQYRLPTYNHWLLHQADMAPAYRWHRRYLQHLQSRHPGRASGSSSHRPTSGISTPWRPSTPMPSSSRRIATRSRSSPR